jgi:hypothetical protein
MRATTVGMSMNSNVISTPRARNSAFAVATDVHAAWSASVLEPDEHATASLRDLGRKFGFTHSPPRRVRARRTFLLLRD